MYEIKIQSFSGGSSNSLVNSDDLDVVLVEIKKLMNDFRIIKIINLDSTRNKSVGFNENNNDTL